MRLIFSLLSYAAVVWVICFAVAFAILRYSNGKRASESFLSSFGLTWYSAVAILIMLVSFIGWRIDVAKNRRIDH